MGILNIISNINKKRINKSIEGQMEYYTQFNNWKAEYYRTGEYPKSKLFKEDSYLTQMNVFEMFYNEYVEKSGVSKDVINRHFKSIKNAKTAYFEYKAKKSCDATIVDLEREINKLKGKIRELTIKKEEKEHKIRLINEIESVNDLIDIFFSGYEKDCSIKKLKIRGDFLLLKNEIIVIRDYFGFKFLNDGCHYSNEYSAIKERTEKVYNFRRNCYKTEKELIDSYLENFESTDEKMRIKSYIDSIKKENDDVI